MYSDSGKSGFGRKKPGIADLPLPPMIIDEKSPEDMDTDEPDMPSDDIKHRLSSDPKLR